MNVIDPDSVTCRVFVLSEQYPAFDGPWHAHQRAQLIYASNGLLTIRTTSGLWIVPPQRAVWIVPGELHKGSSPKPLELRTLYAVPESTPMCSRCCVVEVDRLLDALLVEASGYGADYPLGGTQERLMHVILDRLSGLKRVPSYLPTPRDPRLARLTAVLEGDATDARPLEMLATQSGLTSRTAARLFVKETGLTFAQWRQQLRLLRAMQSLNQGCSVTQVAAGVGYSDVSSFIAVFKKAFGDTPARYVRAP